MESVCCSATAGGSFAHRIRSRSSWRAMKRAARNDWRRSAARWKNGCATRVFECDMNTRRWLMLTLGVAAVLLVLGRALAGVYSDYLWYDALGAGALWRLRMSAVLTLRAGSAVGAGLFAFCNLYAVRQSVVQLVFPRRVGNLEISEEVSGRYLMGAAVILSAVLVILLAIPPADWMALV